MQAPDFPGGGQILFDREQMGKVYETGRGSFRVRSRYSYDKGQNCIDVTQIPPTTTIEVIVERVIDLVKQGKVKEIADIRDETGLDGLKITIDLKRGTDPDKLMQKLFKLTTLEDSFACNFNVLIGGVPRVLGVRELLEEWTAFRVECVRRRTYYDCLLYTSAGKQHGRRQADEFWQGQDQADERREAQDHLCRCGRRR